MKIVFRLCVILGLSAGAWACSGSGYGSGTSGSVAPSAPNGDAGIVTVNVVAIRGAQSFSPNPATLPAGQRIVWRNIDSVTHRVVLNDGSVDTGNLAPGATSAVTIIGGNGAAYHCSIHPEMVGSINMDVASAPVGVTY